jgi:hypothetical protein
MNRTDEHKDFRLWVDGWVATTRSPAHSIVTLVHAVDPAGD